MQRHHIVLAVALTLAAGACGGESGSNAAAPAAHAAAATTTSSTSPSTSTSTSTTTSTTIDPAVLAALEKQADTAKIQKLWRDYSDAWSNGVAYAVRYSYDHNYPTLRETETVAKCLGAYNDYPKNYAEEYIVDAATVQRDDGWNAQIGHLRGPRQGRVYVFTMHTNYAGAGINWQPRTDEAHVSILDDGNPYFFTVCG